MNALVLEEGGAAIRHRRPQAPGPGQASVGLRLGGVCATDLELVRGYMGFRGVLGHEFVGVVQAADDPRLVGRRVVGEINHPCGTCPTCRAGRPRHCPTRTVLGLLGWDGAFADQFVVPLSSLHEVPDGVPDDAAVFAEPLAAACEILEQVHLRPHQRAVVLGAGRLGQLVARVLALTGAEVAAVARRVRALALLPPGVRPVPAAEAQALAGADLVVDCTGAPEGLALASRLVRPRGTLVLKTTVHDPAPPPVVPWVVDEITVVGSRCGPLEPALRLLASGAVDPRPLVTARLPLARGVEALDLARSPDHLKVLLEGPA